MRGMDAWGWTGLCRACAALGSMSGRPEQRPGGRNYLLGAWRGQTIKEGYGTKGPKRTWGCTVLRGQEKGFKEQGVGSPCPRGRGAERERPLVLAPGRSLGLGWESGLTLTESHRSLPAPHMGPECPRVCTRPHRHLPIAPPFPPAPRRDA